MSTARILIIAGSDSGGGAGIQADIKTVTMLGGHAMTAIAAITAQNTLGVTAIHPVPFEMVLAQMDAVISDIGVDAVKIGMIGGADIAHAVAGRLEAMPDVPVIFDPVMVATSGSVLADVDTVVAFARLMDRATLVTPNVPELAALMDERVETVDQMELAAQQLARRHGCSVLAKGGHLGAQPDEEKPLVHDLLVTGDAVVDYANPRMETLHSHGTGCTLASAIAMGIGAGLLLEDAVDRAEYFVRAALRAAPALGRGNGPMGHGLGVVPFYHLLAAMDEDGWKAEAFEARWPPAH